jgi:hypothetical protein
MWYYASTLPACEVEILLNGLAWVAQFGQIIYSNRGRIHHLS